MPSLTIIYIISLFLDGFMANKYVAYAFVGIKCAVAFLIFKAGMNMLSKVEKKPLPLATFWVVFCLLLVLELLAVELSAIVLILLGGILGICVYTGKGEVK